MKAASLGGMPKKAASNRSTPSRNPPQRLAILPAASGPSDAHSRQSQRSLGTSVIASIPSNITRAKLSGSTIPPGKRQPIPITATAWRSEEHTSELQSLMRISYAVFCLKKKKNQQHNRKYEK